MRSIFHMVFLCKMLGWTLVLGYLYTITHWNLNNRMKTERKNRVLKLIKNLIYVWSDIRHEDQSLNVKAHWARGKIMWKIVLYGFEKLRISCKEEIFCVQKIPGPRYSTNEWSKSLWTSGWIICAWFWFWALAYRVQSLLWL